MKTFYFSSNFWSPKYKKANSKLRVWGSWIEVLVVIFSSLFTIVIAILLIVKEANLSKSWAEKTLSFFSAEFGRLSQTYRRLSRFQLIDAKSRSSYLIFHWQAEISELKDARTEWEHQGSIYYKTFFPCIVKSLLSW